jgi:hypothetical protein
MIRKVDMERFSVTSSRPFDAVVVAIKASIGHPNMAEFWQATQGATTAAELEAAIQPVLGESGLMQFVEFDHGMIVRKGTEHHTSRIIRLIIGNPLIMKEMAKCVPDAGSYAPVTVLVMSTLMACIFRMTGWPASWPLMEMAMRCAWLATWTLKSKMC